MEKGFWIPMDGGHTNDTDGVFGNSTRNEPKRAREWFLDPSETELFPSKKRAIECPISKEESGIAITDSLHWDSSSGFPAVPAVPTLPNQFMDRLFGSETTSPLISTERDIPISAREKISGQFENDSSVGLSISYAMEDLESGLSYSGLRKIKVNQVKDPNDGLNTSVEHGLGVSMEQTYNRTSENTSVQMRSPYTKEGGNAMLMAPSYNTGVANNRSMEVTFDKGLDNTMSVAPSYNKGDNHNISFGGYHDESVLEALARPMSSYSLLYEQSTSQTPKTPARKEMDMSNHPAIVSTSQTSKSKLDCTPKNKLETKPAKKEAPNSFPSNVRSLIATGILDGVPVRYVSVSREELRGIIKGSGYLCGCQLCNYSKALNAYEFERHAGSKTKHPNNHIYFENGKTIYQIVQELRTTPQSMLFDSIQTVTGSPINQKAFRSWKESFQAATREIQRIYGKEELNL